MDRTTRTSRTHAVPSRSAIAVLLLVLATLLAPPARAQDNIFTGTSSGVTSIRIAVADFKPLAADAQTAAFKQTFDATLYADLATAGIFDIVSKSLMPPGTPGAPAEVQLQSYSNAPASASMLAFGSLGQVGGKLLANGYLFDAKNLQYPQVLAKQYSEDPSEDSARQIAHRFADEIIYRLGGGTPGIAETKIYYVHISGGDKEIWAMDYDGANQHPITHLGTISISPRVSPDNTRLAFASFGKYGFQLKMYSLLLNRYIAFPSGNGSALVSRLGAQRQRTRLRLRSQRLLRDLGRRLQRQPWPPHHQLPRRQRLPHLQPQDRRADRLHQRPHRPAPALRHELRRLRRAADDRRRLRLLALLVAQRTVHRLRLGPQVRPRRARRTGHLHHGGRHQEMDPSSPTTVAAATSPPGRPTAATSSTPTLPTVAPSTCASGPCSPTDAAAPLTGPGADMPNWSWK